MSTYLDFIQNLASYSFVIVDGVNSLKIMTTGGAMDTFKITKEIVEQTIDYMKQNVELTEVQKSLRVELSARWDQKDSPITEEQIQYCLKKAKTVIKEYENSHAGEAIDPIKWKDAIYKKLGL